MFHVEHSDIARYDGLSRTRSDLRARALEGCVLEGVGFSKQEQLAPRFQQARGHSEKIRIRSDGAHRYEIRVGQGRKLFESNVGDIRCTELETSHDLTQEGRFSRL